VIIRRRQIVWGCDGAGQDAADRFFAELDPPAGAVSEPHPAAASGEQAKLKLPAALQITACMERDRHLVVAGYAWGG
jgi:hypothetical protein